MKPKISVIITTYNDAEYLRRSLDHLVDQTMKELEFICVDDASSDDSVKIIKEYVKKDSRFHLVALKKNVGLSGARNAGLKKATAPYVMFCDGDDFYKNAMCEKMYSAIHYEKVDFAACELGVIYEAHEELKESDDSYYRLKQAGHCYIDDDFVRQIDMSVDNKIFRRDVIEKNHLEFPEGLKFEDTFFVIAYSADSLSAYLVNEKLYRYTRRQNSIMTSAISKKYARDFSIDNIYIFTRLHEYFEKHNLMETRRDLYWDMFALYVGSAHNWCKSKEMRDKIRQTVSKFISDNQAEIDLCDKNIQKAVAYVNSKYFFSTRYKIFHKTRDKFFGVTGRILRKLSKISTSQRWALSKLWDLNLDTSIVRSDITHFRREQRAKEK